MFSFVFMKVFESSPKRYDFGINLLSFGQAQKIKHCIADNFSTVDDRILDIGCGTATLSIMMARNGARVDALDPDARMLDIARQKVTSAGLTERIHLFQLGVAQMDTHFLDESYDKIVSTLVFSELSDDEQQYALKQCLRILKPNGLLIIADEVRPESIPKRFLYTIVRLPMSVATFLISAATTRPLQGITERLNHMGFKILFIEKQFGDAFETIVARKENHAEE